MLLSKVTTAVLKNELFETKFSNWKRFHPTRTHPFEALLLVQWRVKWLHFHIFLALIVFRSHKPYMQALSTYFIAYNLVRALADSSTQPYWQLHNEILTPRNRSVCITLDIILETRIRIGWKTLMQTDFPPSGTCHTNRRFQDQNLLSYYKKSHPTTYLTEICDRLCK